MNVGQRSSSASFSYGKQIHPNLSPDIREATNILIRIPVIVDRMDAVNPTDTKAGVISAPAFATMEAT